MRLVRQAEVYGLDALGGVFDLVAVELEELGTVREVAVLRKGALDGEAPVLARVQSACLTGEVFRSRQCDCAEQLRRAASTISHAGRGVILYLPWQEGKGHGLVDKVRSMRKMEGGLTSLAAYAALGLVPDRRRYEAAWFVLKELGIYRIKLLSGNQEKVESARRAGLEVVEWLAV